MKILKKKKPSELFHELKAESGWSDLKIILMVLDLYAELEDERFEYALGSVVALAGRIIEATHGKEAAVAYMDGLSTTLEKVWNEKHEDPSR